MSFQGAELPPEAGGGRHFALVVPADQMEPGAIRTVLLEGPSVRSSRTRPPATAPGEQPGELSVSLAQGAEATLRWDGERFPMALVRDATTGRVVSFARGGEVRVPRDGDALEVSLSDGVGSHAHRLRVP